MRDLFTAIARARAEAELELNKAALLERVAIELEVGGAEITDHEDGRTTIELPIPERGRGATAIEAIAGRLRARFGLEATAPGNGDHYVGGTLDPGPDETLADELERYTAPPAPEPEADPEPQPGEHARVMIGDELDDEVGEVVETVDDPQLGGRSVRILWPTTGSIGIVELSRVRITRDPLTPAADADEPAEIQDTGDADDEAPPTEPPASPDPPSPPDDPSPPAARRRSPRKPAERVAEVVAAARLEPGLNLGEMGRKLGLGKSAMSRLRPHLEASDELELRPTARGRGATIHPASGQEIAEAAARGAGEPPPLDPDDDGFEEGPGAIPDPARGAGGTIKLGELDEIDRSIVEALIHKGRPITTAEISIATGLARDAVGGRAVGLRNRGLIRGVRPANSEHPPRWAIANR